MKTIALDFETFYIKRTPLDPGYSVQQLGNWRYTHDERFDAYMVSVCDGREALACAPEDFDWECLAGCTLLSHNAAFDMAVYERLVELGKVPRIEFAAWHCTANLTSFLCSRRSLADAVKHLLDIKVSKSERDAMNKKTWEDAQKEGLAESLTEYAKNDVRYCWQLWDKFSDQWPEHERRLSALTIRQGQRGIAIDKALLEADHKLIKTAIWHMEGDMPWIEAGAKPGSTKAIAEQCRKAGIPTPPVKKHEGEEAFEEWENTYGPRFPWVAAISSYKSLNKVLGTLETIQERLKPDGTIDFSLLYFGGHTGRWSGGGSGLNLQNLLKDSMVFSEGKYIGKKLDLVKASRMPEGATELNMRHLFVPRPGKKFVIADASQIEPRILNWVAGNFELLRKIGEGFSYYEAYAATFEGWEGAPGTIKKDLTNEAYTKLKNKCLGLGYQMGWRKYTSYAGVSEEEAKAVVEGFRKENPKLVALWEYLDKSFRVHVGQEWDCQLPSGRVMRYGKVLRQMREKANAEGIKVPKVVYTGLTSKSGGRIARTELYGGILTENMIQATARDVLAYHLLELDRQGVNVVFHVHDEFISEVDKDFDPGQIVKVMSKCPDWLPGCPLAAEASEHQHYTK